MDLNAREIATVAGWMENKIPISSLLGTEGATTRAVGGQRMIDCVGV